MKYPITPEYLENAPKPLVKAILAMEDDLLREICSRFKLTGELNEVTINDIRTLKAYGLDMDTIERRIANHTKTSTEEVRDALDRAVKLNREYYGELSDKAGITMPLEIVTAREIELIRKQMLDEYRNITRSLGFAVQTNGKIVFRPIAKAYQAVLDKAEMKTVPIMIAQLRAADYSKFDLGKVYMFILLAILPVLLVYIFLSRYIVKGVTAGSVKG